MIAPDRILFLDLDGVMADFDAHFPVLFGCDHREIPDEEMWGHIDGHGSFFRVLPPCPGALEFYNEVRHLYPVILTACPSTGYESVARQKREWVREWLGPEPVVMPVMGRKAKPLFMHNPGDILIDDFERNVKLWREHGGHGIHHRNFTDTRLHLAALLGEPA